MTELNNNGTVVEAPANNSNSNKSKVYYDQNGNPVFVQQNPNVGGRLPEPKTGAFIGSIVTLVLAIVCLALSYVLSIQLLGTVEPDDGITGILVFLAYLISGVGFITFIPSLGLSIAAVSCSAVACKSSKKGFKIVAIINTVLSTLCLIATIALPFLFLFVFQVA